jgi:hypothetical protein
MKATYSYFLSAIFLTCAHAGEKDSLVTHTSQEMYFSSHAYLTFLYAPNLTARAGAEDILTLHYGITRIEDAILGTHWFYENTIIEKTGGIILRTIKCTFLDLPIDDFSSIFTHEYFGHGTRLRELSNADITYQFNARPPYGKGGAHTSSIFNKPSNHERLAIYEGGIESQSILNRTIALHWMSTGEIQYREAFLYFFTFNSIRSYIQNTPENLFSDASYDPALYLRILNAQAGFNNMNNLKMGVGEFKAKMKWSMVNPFFYYSIYYFLKTYLWDGNSTSAFPTFQFGDIHYLPVIRSGMTPFGPEYHLENYLHYGKTVSLIDFRVGDQTFYTSWGGLGFAFFNIISWNKCSADVNVDVWKQPELIFGGNPGVSKGGGLGGAVSVRGYYNFTDLNNSLAAIIELGYKSVGFLEGYKLDASPVFMIGLGYRL